MIAIQNLSRIYRTDEIETTALNAISLNIESGDFVSIMGPSGCGKTTLLNIIGLLDQSNDGQYDFLGKNMNSLSRKERSIYRKDHIGFVFQNFNLIEELNVFENVELPLVYKRLPSKERRVKVDAILQRMGIAHRAKHFPQQLSGGQQQRVAVARALVTNPEVILADEPTGNLDSTNGQEVMELLCELNKQGTTIIMVTHSQHDANFSKRVINLLDGQIVSEKNRQASF